MLPNAGTRQQNHGRETDKPAIVNKCFKVFHEKNIISAFTAQEIHLQHKIVVCVSVAQVEGRVVH